MLRYNYNVFKFASTSVGASSRNNKPKKALHMKNTVDTNNKSELWPVYTMEQMVHKAAGYKAAASRKLMVAKSRCEKDKIINECLEKIKRMLDDCNKHNLEAVRHNAAVKAHATRRAMRHESKCDGKKYASCACMSVSKKRK